MNSANNICPYCKSTDVKTYKKIGNYFISYCNACHLLFTAQVSATLIDTVNRKWYSDEYISDYLKKALKIKERFRQKIRQVESIIYGGNLLDLGCGVGLFLESMNDFARFKWRLFGVDFNQRLIKEAKIRVGQRVSNLYAGRLKSLNLRERSFDCITCFDVLEHDDQLESTLSEIKKILKPSGLLFIQSPNYGSLMAYLCGSSWDWWAVPDHVFHFNSQSLSSILRNHGFHIRKLYTWDPVDEFISNIQGSVKARLGINSLLGKLTSKCLYIPLLILWSALVMVEKKFNIGSLLVILAES